MEILADLIGLAVFAAILAIVLAVLAVLLATTWMSLRGLYEEWPRRFRLRSLLLAVTLIQVLWGTAAWLSDGDWATAAQLAFVLAIVTCMLWLYVVNIVDLFKSWVVIKPDPRAGEFLQNLSREGLPRAPAQHADNHAKTHKRPWWLRPWRSPRYYPRYGIVVSFEEEDRRE